MRRLHRPAALIAGTLAIAWIAVPAQPIASAAPAGTVKLRLTGLNRDSKVVAVPQASLLGLPNGVEYLYQGRPLAVRAGTYLIAAEVPAFSGTVQTSDTLVFAKVAGPGPSFPQTSVPNQGAPGTLISYAPLLYTSPGTHGGQICCDSSRVSLRLGSRVIRTERVGNQGFFDAVIHRSGWYTLNVTDHRSFPGGGVPVGLLSPKVAVSFRFHAPAHPAGNGAGQYVPVTDARYDPLGLNSANQAPAGGTTVLNVTIARPGNAGIPTPVYRLKAVKFYASFNDGASWQLLTALRHGSGWRVTITDPSSGYVAIRSIVTDVRGDSTEQTVYRAYGVTGP